MRCGLDGYEEEQETRLRENTRGAGSKAPSNIRDQEERAEKLSPYDSLWTQLDHSLIPRPPSPAFVACSTKSGGKPGRIYHVMRAAADTMCCS